MSYCTTPLANEYSPAKQSMNRKLHSTVPIYILKIATTLFTVKNERTTLVCRVQLKRRFNTCHKLYNHYNVVVWVPEFQQNATILSEVTPHLYVVQSPTGIVIYKELKVFDITK